MAKWSNEQFLQNLTSLPRPQPFASLQQANLEVHPRTCSTKAESSSSLQDTETGADVAATFGFGRLVDSARFSDVTFLLGSEEVPVYGHRVLLAARSPVFQAMLFSEFAESRRGAVIKVPDIEPAVFREMLHCMYTNKLSTSTPDDEHALNLLFCAKKYDVAVLRHHCMRALRRSIDPEKALVLLDAIPAVFEDERKMYLDYIARNTDKALESERFVAISEDTLVAIVACPHLSIKEAKLLEHCIAWGRSQLKHGSRSVEAKAKETKESVPASSALVSVLRRVLPFIRFPIMGLPGLLLLAKPNGLLKQSDLLELVCHSARGSTALRVCGYNATARTPNDLETGILKTVPTTTQFLHEHVPLLRFSRDSPVVVLLKPARFSGWNARARVQRSSEATLENKSSSALTIWVFRATDQLGTDVMDPLALPGATVAESRRITVRASDMGLTNVWDDISVEFNPDGCAGWPDMELVVHINKVLLMQQNRSHSRTKVHFGSTHWMMLVAEGDASWTVKQPHF